MKRWSRFRPLHVEYLAEQPQGLRYTAFSERYREWLKRQSPVMRQVHLAGDKLFVDYSGLKAKLVDSVTGEVIESAPNCAITMARFERSRCQGYASTLVGSGTAKLRRSLHRMSRPE